jgi:hypothetical protein
MVEDHTDLCAPREPVEALGGVVADEDAPLIAYDLLARIARRSIQRGRKTVARVE